VACSDYNATLHSDTVKPNANCYIKIFFLNPTSLAKPGAVQLLQTELVQGNIGIALIAESWFSKAHDDNVVSIENYSIFRRDRCKRKGGGLCAYVRNDIGFHLCESLNHDCLARNNLEIMWIEGIWNGNYYYIACCYHPPRPFYANVDFCEALSSDIDVINTRNSHSIIIIAGDFNQLDTKFLCTDFGFTQIVEHPTHGQKVLDKVFVNRPDIYSAEVFASVIKTKHCAVTINPCTDSVSHSHKRRQISFYDLRSQNIDKLRYYIGVHDWSDLLLSSDVELMYSEFVSRIKYLISYCVPRRCVTLGPKDPPHITPLVKYLLRRRYRLRRHGRINEANELALKINSLITENRRTSFNKLLDAGPRELWAAVKSTAGHRYSRLSCIDRDQINKFFANVSTNPLYDINNINCYRQATDEHLLPLCDYEVEEFLRQVKRTSAGCDDLPAWLFKNCSYELASIVAHILNCSFSSGVVPSYWLRAIVTPVPKVSNPSTFPDFRPISVTPILSRIAEKIVVRKWLRPAIPPAVIADQYAFKLTGSTTAALVHFTHHASRMLEENHYVRCLMIDFTKAFDTVDHAILMSKLVGYNVSSLVVNWILSFLTGRSQVCKVNGQLSAPCPINQGIVQGSGIGPQLYITMKSDLKPISTDNNLFKYADDTTLLVPEHSAVDIVTEFHHIQAWATANKLCINTKKTKEIVLLQPRARSHHMVLSIDDVERVASIKLLGIIFQDNFKMDTHVNFVLSQCSQRLYLLKLLRSQGFSPAQLDQVSQALIVSRLRYALPVWSGFLSADLINRIQALLKRLFKFGYSLCLVSFRDLMQSCSEDLFDNAHKSNHCLHGLLSSYVHRLESLRPRGHDLMLPACTGYLHKQSFITRSLFEFI